MSGVRITELTNTTDIGNGDYVATDGTQGTRKISFNNLSGKTLDKLSSKEFSDLNTASKNIPGAVNELNARIANIVAQSGVPTMTEVVDIRTNFLGETFPTAGEAVRASDQMAADLENTPIKITNNMSLYSGDTYPTQCDTYSAEIDRYYGGKLVVFTNINAGFSSNAISSLVSHLNVWSRLSNTAQPDTQNGVVLPQSLKDFWLAHASLQELYTFSGTYKRYMYSLPLPEDLEYKYFWYSVMNATYESFWSVTLVKPYASFYGKRIFTPTFTDPDSDGNIIIS